MKLILDCGSTKCAGVLVDRYNKCIQTFRFEGYNPMLHHNISNSVYLHFKSLKHNIFTLDQLLFCGAGCIDPLVNNEVVNGLHQIFPNAEIEVLSDLELIGKALNIIDNSVIAILGTGSNAGFWDGDKIAQKSFSGGYLLGDEGSGYALGKKLVINYLRSNFSSNTQAFLHSKIGKNYVELTNEIYSSKLPNKLVASYASFFKDINDPIKDIILESEFRTFIKNQIEPLKRDAQVVHIFGSISFFNISYIKPLLEEVNLKIGNIARGPLDLLLNDEA